MFNRSHSTVILVASALLIGIFSLALGEEKACPPPTTEVKTVVDTLHGVAIEDPYRWLEDQECPETRAWIDAQNEYTRSFFPKFPNQKKVESRLAELMKIDDIGMPMKQGGRYFLGKRAAEQEQAVLYMRESLDGEDRVLVDPHDLSPDHNVSVGLSDVSLDGKLLAYELRQGGQDETTIHFLDVDVATIQAIDAFLEPDAADSDEAEEDS